MTPQVVLFGATGYQGGLTLEALVRRGIRPVLAGLSAERLAPLAAQHGDLTYRIADAAKPAELTAILHPGDVLVSTVGPFEQYGYPVAQAAVDAGAHYLDSAGEVGFVRELRRRQHARAQATGVVLSPTFGYDYIPGILAATLAAEQAGRAATELEIGYFAIGSLRNGLSQGTRKTIAQGLVLPSLVYRDGHLVERRTAGTVRAFSVRGTKRDAILASGTEVMFLPEQLPQLRTVTVYNGWFPGLSRAMQLGSAVANLTVRLPGGREVFDALSSRTTGPAGGPDATERSRTRSHVVAVARDSSGAILAQTHLEGPSPYNLTGELMAWAAGELADGNGQTPGVVGPVQAFGLARLRTGANAAGLTEI